MRPRSSSWTTCRCSASWRRLAVFSRTRRPSSRLSVSSSRAVRSSLSPWKKLWQKLTYTRCPAVTLAASRVPKKKRESTSSGVSAYSGWGPKKPAASPHDCAIRNATRVGSGTGAMLGTIRVAHIMLKKGRSSPPRRPTTKASAAHAAAENGALARAGFRCAGGQSDSVRYMAANTTIMESRQLV